MTKVLFHEDAYLKEANANVIEVNDRGGIILNQTIFYATSGGQPGDSGTLKTSSGLEIKIAVTVYGEDKSEIIHVPNPDQNAPEIGEEVVLNLDWNRRFNHMRSHTALHLLSVAVPFPVTGGQISEEGGRLDFDIPELTVTKEDITKQINDLISEKYDVTCDWITDDELKANPNLVKTMSVKPPMGSGRVRLIRIGDNVDLQPCGGTHVANTSEIGEIEIRKIENKGRQNRRIRLALLN